VDKMLHNLELLAPAGDWNALEAALAAGADAVYFGLRTLNARRRARNFSQEEFVKAVESVHAREAKAYLTLNIDLTERELGQAARALELARQCRVDAVLVRDPALLALQPQFPELEFHFSTQTCMTNSADVAAAGKLGATRVVLARELTLGEIAGASSVPGVQTEVFVQGALCFSISGRCLLSSWAGGRSGNRGACTSPCRVPWSLLEKGDITDFQDFPLTPLSMKDLSLIGRLPELRRAGVSALKIEGRLKNAEWVSRAVSIYKRALAGETCDKFLEEAEQLGDYTGRTMTSGYLDKRRDDLTAQAEGRQSQGDVAEDGPHPNTLPTAGAVPGERAGESEPFPTSESAPEEESNEPTYDLGLMIEQKGVACSCVCGPRTEKWTIPKTMIRRPHKAIAIGTLFEQLAEGALQGFRLGRRETNDAEFLLTPRAVNGLVDRISRVIRLANKQPDDLVRIDLPPAISELLIVGEACRENQLCPGKEPDRVRLDVNAATAFFRRVRPKGAIIEGLSQNTLGQMRAVCGDIDLIAALPQVFFENDLPEIKKLLQRCADEGVTVEVNSWGGWRLAKAVGATMEAGPGLPVLNSLAARVLKEKGMKCVTLSPEADRRQLEELTAHCAAPCSLVVFGRPPLITTRVEVPKRLLDQVLTDRRNIQIVPRREHGLCVFRPVEPFDLRGSANERIRVKHLVVDLIGSDNPVGDWHNVPLPDDVPFQFNYDRTLA
jgi:U32 family peptidase